MPIDPVSAGSARDVATDPGHFVRVHDTGGDRPVLVLVHGYTGSSHDWSGVLEPLAATHRVVTLDHRGHGDSSNHGHPAAYTFDQLLADFERVIDDLGVAHIHLLGHSMGGVIAMRYVLAHPERVASLVLMDTAAEPSGMPVEIIEQLAQVARADGMEALFAQISAFAGVTEVDPVDAARFARMDVEAFAALGAELGTYPSMLAALASVACPTTVIVGESDLGLRGAADALAATIPGARLRVIAGAGHSPQQDQPAAWLAAVHEHLRVRPASTEVGAKP